ncbi:Probable transmembrane protein [plant metagenome]|jgi:hypothetical protein|uniref:Probable transmembrane protein n=2 Tax=root TaxID=1 RepID=A0A1C3K4K2_9BURK|nr:DUF2970 domain-containing protein [Orrella dioscoreae]SBT26335.1 Probable transmembrane protein [Orrella dioscoreae]SOE46462.1 Probable transmembrane protein [Orrella dioscoreae]
MSDDLRDASQRKLNFLQTLKAVLWALFGVRKGAGYDQDVARLNPVHVIIAGLLAAAIFVTVLIFIVRWAAGGAA